MSLTPKEIICLDRPLSYTNVVNLRVKAARKLDIIEGSWRHMDVCQQVGREGREGGKHASSKVGYLNMQSWCATNAFLASVLGNLQMCIHIFNQYLCVHLDPSGRCLRFLDVDTLLPTLFPSLLLASAHM